MVVCDDVRRDVITLLTLYLIVVRDKIRDKLPCSLAVLPLSLGWRKERRWCSSAAFPSAPLIVYDLRQRAILREEVAALSAPWHTRGVLGAVGCFGVRLKDSPRT